MRGNRRSWLCFAAVVAVACLAMSEATAAMAAGDANAASCSNESSPGFRAFMPDCRGYEMVTPPYQGGQPMLLSNVVDIPMSPDGSRLVGIDFAGFDEAGNLEQSTDFGAAYEMERTAAGWRTEALEPPAAMAARSEFASAGEDLNRTLWRLSEQAPGEELDHVSGFDLYIREPGDGGARWTLVGPDQPEALPGDEHGDLAFVGASSDLSDLLLATDRIEPMYWPGDRTQPEQPSLYQYEGAANSEPELVGLKSAGRLSGSPLNEGAELESECGTILGSDSEEGGQPVGSAYNAVSATGGVVYFSALHVEGCERAQPPATELFARVENGTAAAHTVAISEPTAGDCEACDVSEPAAARFEGASADGQRVVFTSEQALLAGASGDSLYEFDMEGPAGHHLTLVAPDVAGVSRLSEDGGRLYFVSERALEAAPDSGLTQGHEQPAEGQPNLYVYEAGSGSLAFVATLSPTDEALWSSADHRPIQVSADGRYALFSSAGRLTSGDEATVAQLFEYDSLNHTLTRVSIGQTGEYPCSLTGTMTRYDCNGDLNGGTSPLIYAPEFEFRSRPTDASSRLSLGPAGEVVFTSPDALTPGAVMDRPLPETRGLHYVENVYEYEHGNVYLIAPGDEEAPLQDNEDSRLIGISPTGGDVFFKSTGQLVPQDIDSQSSWYDARLDGGLPPVLEGLQCGEGTCQVTAVQPAPGTPAGTELSAAEPAPGAIPSSKPKPKPKPLTRAQKLARALKACAKLRRRTRRRSCRRTAERRYGPLTREAKTKGAHR